MLTGKIKYFNTEKGYGFIIRDDGAGDVFVHLTGLVDRYGGVRVGDRVSFLIEQDQRSGRPRAAGVEVVFP